MIKTLGELFGIPKQAVCIKTTGVYVLLNVYEIGFFGDSRAIIVHTDSATVRVFSRSDFDEHFKMLDSGEGRG